jgi:MerR family transcriptional regulator, light-induced transcriptional regulator
MTGAPAWPVRRALAETLRGHRDAVAGHVTEEFLQRHPEWVVKYGDAASTRGMEDARFHIDFLAGAIEGGDPRAFSEYAQWTAGVLDARGMAPEFLIENLHQVGADLAGVLDPADAAYVARYIEAACDAAASRGKPGTGIHADVLHTQRRVYVQSVLNGERRGALNVALELLREGYTVADVYCDLLQPAQYEVGRLWERNEITVAREHMATAITQFVVAQLYSRLEVPDSSRGRIVVTGVRGELHQLGANMVADVLEADGWNVRFLGTQTPHGDILKAIDEHEPAVVGISATMLFNLMNVSDLVEGVQSRFGSEVRLVVGGSAFRGKPDLWREIGAHGFGHDLRAAVAAVRAVTGG